MTDKEIYIVAGGNSLRDFDFSKLKNKEIIAVNKSILDVPFAKYFITMDYTFINKKLKEKKGILLNSQATKVFILNLLPDYMVERDGRIIDIRFNYVYELNLFNMIIKSYNKHGIGYSFKDFKHGNNSGFCALQMAICLGYTKIHLLGFDLMAEKETHYHGGYNQNPETFRLRLKIYLENFLYSFQSLKIERPDIEIYSYCENSPLNALLKVKKLEDI